MNIDRARGRHRVVAPDCVLRLTLRLKQHDPGRVLEFETKKLPGDIGYIKFNFFFGDLLAKFKAAIQELRETHALIIDLRDNPGGAGDMAPAPNGKAGGFRYHARYRGATFAGRITCGP